MGTGSRLFVRATAWLIAERIVKLGVGFVAAVWVARYLGPEQYGTFAFSISFTLLFSELTTLGLNALLARSFVEHSEDVGTVIGTAITLRLAAGVIAGVSAVLLIATLSPGDAQLGVMIAVLAVSFVFRAGEVFEQYFYSLEDMRPPAVSRISSSGVQLALSAGMILARISVVGFAVAKTLETVFMNLAFAAAYLRRHHEHRWRFDAGLARRMMSVSWPLILSGFGATLNLRVDQVMLASLSGTEEVGFYAVASQLSEVWYFVPTAIMTAALPALVRLKRRDPEAYARRYQSSFDAMLWLGIVVATVVSLVASFVVPTLFGERYLPSVPMLVIHVWGGSFVAMRAVLSKWIVTEGFTTVSLVTHGLGAAANVAANLLLIPAYGGVGAAVATVFSYAVSSYLALFVWRRTWPVAWMMTKALTAPVRHALAYTRGTGT